uniref:uncharacterized protein LOC117154741 n=1 Tax=Bombus vancouverensis nearcticus TaxID=2705178 RepID=UPI0014387B5C|nr:uncharacterized protein LOC117154741 [Bombus vancouverensis nearcticus]
MRTQRGTRKRKCRAEHLSARAPGLCQYGLTISNGSRSAQLGHKGALEELILVLSNGGATRGPASLVTIPGRSVEVTTTKEPERVQVSSPIHKHSREKKLVKTGLEGRSNDERGGWGRVAAGWNGASVFRIVMGEEKLTGTTRSFPSLDPTPISKRVTGDCFRLLPVYVSPRASFGLFYSNVENNVQGIPRRRISYRRNNKFSRS